MASAAAGLALAGAPGAASLACAVACGAALGVLGASRLGVVAAVLLLAGAAAGHARLDALDAPAGRIHDHDYVTVRATLLGAARPGAFGSSAQVQVRGGRLAGAR